MHTNRSTGLRAACYAGALLMAGAVSGGRAVAQSPPIAGAWQGSGTVTLSSGNTERVRCRATFSAVGAGATMSATCATPSTNVRQTAELTRVTPTRYVGDFHNADYNISGNIRIVINGNSMTAQLAGGGGSAFLNLSR